MGTSLEVLDVLRRLWWGRGLSPSRCIQVAARFTGILLLNHNNILIHSSLSTANTTFKCHHEWEQWVFLIFPSNSQVINARFCSCSISRAATTHQINQDQPLSSQAHPGCVPTPRDGGIYPPGPHYMEYSSLEPPVLWHPLRKQNQKRNQSNFPSLWMVIKRLLSSIINPWDCGICWNFKPQLSLSVRGQNSEIPTAAAPQSVGTRRNLWLFHVRNNREGFSTPVLSFAEGTGLFQRSRSGKPQILGLF